MPEPALHHGRANQWLLDTGARAAGLLCISLLLNACKSEDSVSQQGAPPASAIANPTAPPPPKPEEVRIPVPGGIPLAGDLYETDQADAPLLVLSHRYRGSRAELAATAARLAASQPRYHVLNIDLRGHGASRTDSLGHWNDLPPEELGKLEDDITAAAEYGLAHTSAERVVLVGEGLSATMVARAAAELPQATAIALLCPGAKRSAQKLYPAYSAVRKLPLFVLGTEADTITQEPVRVLSKAARSGVTTKVYPGSHCMVSKLETKHHPVAADLEAWLSSIYTAAPLAAKAQVQKDTTH